MTANLCGSIWLGWDERADLCADVLAACPCAIVGFQEFGAASLEAIAPRRPDLEFVLGEAAGEIFVNTIAFDRDRFTRLDSGTFWLSPDGCRAPGWDAHEARAASWVRLRDRATEAELTVVNTHLDHLGRIARAEGMRLVLDFVDRAAPRAPLIVTADLNVSADSADERWLAADWRRPYDDAIARGLVDAWRITHPGQRRPLTYHGFQGRDFAGDEEGTHDPDVILLRGLECANCVLVRDSRAGVYPSDHYFQMALCSAW
jgi:endonuclease/exonuclease/phosphatase family metal-dependent hydrolase